MVLRSAAKRGDGTVGARGREWPAGSGRARSWRGRLRRPALESIDDDQPPAVARAVTGNLFLDFPAADLPVASSPCLLTSKFAVSCAGDAEYPEDIAIFGTYTIEGTVDLGACGSIGEAIAMAELRTARGDIRPAVSFRPSLIKIVDDDQRLVARR